MDLQSELLREHNKAQTLRIVAHVGDNKEHLKKLMELFLGNDYRITQRAAWPLSYIGIAHPQLIKPYQGTLLKMLKKEGAHDAVKRNILRLWVESMPPENYWGELFDVCYRLARRKDEAIAVRVFAMHVMANIAMVFPELIPEVTDLVEELMLLGQAAFIARGKKVLKLLAKAKK